MATSRYQFHLRGLFVLTTAVAFFLGLNSALWRVGGIEALVLVYGFVVALLLFHIVGRTVGLFAARVVWAGWSLIAYCGRKSSLLRVARPPAIVEETNTGPVDPQQ